MIRIINAIVIALSLGMLPSRTLAQDSLLNDIDGDTFVRFQGFGDSITFGVGDGTSPGQVVSDIPFTDGKMGYLKRISDALKIPVVNSGFPGEEIADGGARRAPRSILNGNADILALMEGSNDAVRRLPSDAYEKHLQRIVNVAVALGKQTILITLPPPCCERASLVPFVDAYNQVIQRIASQGNLRVADVRRAWITSCDRVQECNLYNLPEGLHPNTLGYDVLAQTVMATVLGIDIFAPTGAAELEQALGLPPGSVAVKPSQPPAAPTPPASPDPSAGS